MLMLLILLGMAYAQDSPRFNQPTYMWAGLFAFINLVVGVFSGGFLIAVIGAVILGLYAWGYFSILRRFSDQTILWLAICLAGLILPFLLPLLLSSGKA